MTTVAKRRQRRRRLPATEPRRRAYCPQCGEVQRSYGHWRALYGSDVHPHWREVVQHGSSAVTSVRCPGGRVDLTKDRAP
ncbi:hypothetical protein [Streptomyces sp. NPDC059009]|uniref:hypothetical protein n=1 Tax=Streptomyces sp. NPDC059009 TaxID=3346694 RepID=UPI0036BCAB09